MSYSKYKRYKDRKDRLEKEKKGIDTTPLVKKYKKLLVSLKIRHDKNLFKEDAYSWENKFVKAIKHPIFLRKLFRNQKDCERFKANQKQNYLKKEVHYRGKEYLQYYKKFKYTKEVKEYLSKKGH